MVCTHKRYYYDEIGVNSRLDTIQAAVLKVKLSHLDDYNRKRRQAARVYNEAFRHNPNIITPKTQSCGEICDTCDCHVFHQYTLQITNGLRRCTTPAFAGKRYTQCNILSGTFAQTAGL